jgi:hypothetical protein
MQILSLQSQISKVFSITKEIFSHSRLKQFLYQNTIIFYFSGGDELSDPALEEKMFGRLIIFDGQNGTIYKWMQTPDRRESYYPPQILTSSSGEKQILFGTGGNTRPGSLYVISFKDLLERKLQNAKQIYKDENKGMLTPAAIVDINGDNVCVHYMLSWITDSKFSICNCFFEKKK